MKDVSLFLILKEKGGNQNCLPFCWFKPRSYDILKKEGGDLELVLSGKGE